MVVRVSQMRVASDGDARKAALIWNQTSGRLQTMAAVDQAMRLAMDCACGPFLVVVVVCDRGA